MTYVKVTPVAQSVPFDNDTNGFTSGEVQSAIEEVNLTASGPKGRLPVMFWEFSTYSNNFLYYGGQVKSNEAPFCSSNTGLLNEVAVAGRMTTVNSNALWAFYRVLAASVPTSGNISLSYGSVASVTNQTLVYEESDYPYVGTTRVSISLVNNGPSLPLSFSENIGARTVTIQLATNGGGTVTTTRTQLRDAFRANKTIQQIWRITGSGGTVLSAATFSCAGGSVVNEIAAIHLRANSSNYKQNYEIVINPGDIVLARCVTLDVGTISAMQTTAFVSY